MIEDKTIMLAFAIFLLVLLTIFMTLAFTLLYSPQYVNPNDSKIVGQSMNWNYKQSSYSGACIWNSGYGAFEGNCEGLSDFELCFKKPTSLFFGRQCP